MEKVEQKQLKMKKITKTKTEINWKAFYQNGGYSNENSNPQSYSEEIEVEYFVDENNPEYYYDEDEDDQEF